MSKSIMQIAKRYYPAHWTKAHLDALLKKGALTKEEYDKVIESGDKDDNHE